MTKLYSRLLLVAVLAAVLFMPATILAAGLGSHLAVRCFDTDPNFPTAEGLLTFDSDANSMTLLMDFVNVPPPPPPGVPVPSVEGGFFDLSCNNPFGNPVQYSTAFSGDLAMYGWDFETDFTHVFPPSPTGGTESCVNPQVNSLTFNYDGLFYNCIAGMLAPVTVLP